MADLPDEVMSWENLAYLADFLEASGERALSLLGGEPTLHPSFVDFVLYLVERNFKVNVFTNGIMSPARVQELKDHLTAIPVEKLSFVCNLNNPKQTPAPEQHSERIHEFLSVMGPWTQPGFNIYRTDFDLEFLFEMVTRYGMKHKLRLGLAHPVPGTKSLYIKPQEMGQVIERLFSFRPLFDRFQLDFGPDCGFPMCKFSNEDLGWLYRLGGGDLRFKCGPAIDITPDMSVYACFPLSGLHRKSIFEFDNLGQVAQYYSGIHKKIREVAGGIFPECVGCQQLSKDICSGGGSCQLMNVFPDKVIARLSEIECEIEKTCLPV
jgi:hypothetical protein